MSVRQLREIIDRFVNDSPKTFYYAKPGTTLVRGITEIKSDFDIDDFMTICYQNGFKIDLYVEHHGYDVTKMVRNPTLDAPLVDDYVSSNEELGNGNFIGTLDDPNPPLEGTYVEEADPKEDIIDMKYKVKSGISYPTFNPTTPWNEQKPILGMKYENPLQLKQSLANYGVANGFQMWYMINDFRCLLVYYGRNIAICRCASKRKLKKPFVMSSGPSDNEKTPSKGKGKDKDNESQPEFANAPNKWTK
ncbi:hypothetical protein Tco_1359213 [Tanacetum coccineum]